MLWNDQIGSILTIDRARIVIRAKSGPNQDENDHFGAIIHLL
jgi:hypothetical protein